MPDNAKLVLISDKFKQFLSRAADGGTG